MTVCIYKTHLLTDWAVELIDLILIEAEALTVGGLAVVAVASRSLCLPQTFPVQLLQLLCTHKLQGQDQNGELCEQTWTNLFDLSLWYRCIALIVIIYEGALHFSIWAGHDGLVEAVPGTMRAG